MGARPQAIINRQTLDKCDLLVAIFGTRVGSETGEYDSGTIEEIEEHIALGKPAMVYFSKHLGDSDNFDSDQYAKLEELKKSYENRGLYEVYDGNANFKDKFARQLQIKVNEHEIFQFREEGINFGSGIEESESSVPRLSDIAKVILKEVSRARQGYIGYLFSRGETFILIDGSKNVIPDRNPRTAAQWRAALKELRDAELLEDEGNQGEVLAITPRGYKIADMIEVTT